MAELRRAGLSLQAEQGVLIQVETRRGENYDHDETFAELENLARTAGVKVVGRLRQKRQLPHRKFYLGTGKVRELKALCEYAEADVVVCDDELSVDQVRALESALDRKVVDRSEVILDIFASHARTKQARLQVELAQLEYAFPRLKRMWTHLDRTAGGTAGGGSAAGGGVGVRGPGEKQLEVDRRLVQRRIYELKRNLAKVLKQHDTAAARRKGHFRTVALVGYANAGKSSLMNALTGADVSVRDRLFETLDTRTRTWHVGEGLDVLLSDTVGFVRKFPHHLSASFQATLREAVDADLLLHVIDASKHDSEEEIRAVNEVLGDIGCDGKPTIYVLNKTDIAGDVPEKPIVSSMVDELVCTSALTGEGLAELTRRAASIVTQRVELRVLTGVDNGRLVAFLHENGRIVHQELRDGALDLDVRIPAKLKGAIESMGGRVEEPQDTRAAGR